MSKPPSARVLIEPPPPVAANNVDESHSLDVFFEDFTVNYLSLAHRDQHENRPPTL